MSKPDQESIDTFIGITGLPDTIAVQILQEYGGDLNRAVNAHFNLGDRAIARGASAVALQDDFMDVDEPEQVDPPQVSALDLNHGRRIIPTGTRDVNDLSSQPSFPSTVENGLRRPRAPGSDANGAILIDDHDDENDEVSNIQPTQRPEPSAPVMSNVREADFDVEEEMIRAAIEASKKEAEAMNSSEQFSTNNAQVASSSFNAAVLREDEDPEYTEIKPLVENESQKLLSQTGRLDAESSYNQDKPQILENGVLANQRARHMPSGSIDSPTDGGEGVVSPSSNPILPQLQQNESDFPAEWGGISSAEHDEAVMLEAAMFGGIPETSEYHDFAARRLMRPNLNGNMGPYMMPEPRPPSPTLTAQRQLREQQDDEYFASLQADIEKAEARRLEEQVARDTALAEERRKEEERLRKLEEEQEYKRQLAAKEASIPQEPSPDDATAVNLLVRMPDGSRRGRRFLKSDKLKSLFDYIDIGRVVQPGTYRLVRPYPRRAFGDGDSVLTFSELGLTSKQEALYLELI